MPPEITACLEPGERTVWTGRPRPYIFLLRGLPSMFYGATWSILGACWFYGVGGFTQTPFEGWYKVYAFAPIPFILLGWSFFIYPINLGYRARRTWYVVTDRRAFIARLHRRRPVELRVFTRAEMGPPQVVKRFDGLEEVLLARAAQDRPHLVPRLESGFFGITDGEAAAEAVRRTLEI